MEVVEAMGGETGPQAGILALAQHYVDQPDLDGPWFELGGSSIDAARLVSALDQQFGVALSLRDLLDATSVRECLSAVAAGRTATDQVEVGGTVREAVSPDAVSPEAVTKPAGSAVDELWPSLVRLPPAERIRLAHRLLDIVHRRASERAAEVRPAGR